MKKLLVSLALAGGLVGCAEEKAWVFLDAATPVPAADAGRKDGGAQDGGTPRADAGRDAGRDASRPTTPPADEPRIENLGAPCETDDDCIGADAKCVKALDIPGVFKLPYQDGYCTASCETDDECGEGGVCPSGQLVTTQPAFAAFSSCTLACDRDDPNACREGYACGDLSALGSAKVDSCVPWLPGLTSGTPSGGGTPTMDASTTTPTPDAGAPTRADAGSSTTTLDAGRGTTR